MFKDNVHQRILDRLEDVRAWFWQRREGLAIPFYSSFDLRCSEFKIAVVDGNIYPAGFNNICHVDKEHTVVLITDYLKKNYGSAQSKILLLTEEHTQNAYYWDNVYALQNLISRAGAEVRVGMPRRIQEKTEFTSASGFKVVAEPVVFDSGRIHLSDYFPDLVISNNDFSYDYHAEWGEHLLTPMNPPRELGWYRRRKNVFFGAYNQLAAEFAQILGLDAWHFQVATENFSNFDLSDESRRRDLAVEVDALLQRLHQDSLNHGDSRAPFIFVKNAAGTYGLGVTQVMGGQDILNWTYKERKKMKAAKGGGGFSDVILQEGIATHLTSEFETSEPVIYLIGCQLAGGFLRTHHDKGPTESLNSPGAVYKRLCVADLEIDITGNPLENVYGWVARLGALAIGLEARTMGVNFQGTCRTDN